MSGGPALRQAGSWLVATPVQTTEARRSECHERTAVAGMCTPDMSAECCARNGLHPLKTAESVALSGSCLVATRPKPTVHDRGATQKTV